jgi:biotin operon repressor
MNELYTTNQIAEMIGVTRNCVHQRIERLSLQGMQVGRSRGFTMQQVEQIRNYKAKKPGRKPATA